MRKRHCLRGLENMDLGGGPAHFPELLETEYRLNDTDTSFAQLDQEERRQREAEATMLLAMAAAPLADAKQYGPGDIAFGNNVYDNTKSQSEQKDLKPPGWNSNWEWRYPDTNRPNAKPRWFDPNGGEWRWHAPDNWHNVGHWDYNPWDRWNSEWQNIYHPN